MKRAAFFAFIAVAHVFTCAKTYRLYNQAGLPAGQCVPIKEMGNEPFPILVSAPDHHGSAEFVVVLGADELREVRKREPGATVQMPAGMSGEVKVTYAPRSAGDQEGAQTPSAKVEQLSDGKSRVQVKAPFNEDVVTNTSEYLTRGEVIDPVCYERVDRHTSMFGLKGVERPCGFASAQTVALLLLAAWFQKRRRTAQR